MKSILLFLFIVSSLVISNDPIYVIKVSGEIKHLENGALIKPNDKLHMEDKLIFGDDASAIIYAIGKGRMILKKNVESDLVSSEIAYFVKENLLPISRPAATRSPVIFNNVQDVKTYFRDKYLIWDESSFKLNKDAFPLNQTTFCYIRYTYDNQIVNKRLQHEKNRILIDKKELLRIENNIIDPVLTSEFKLFYYKADEKVSILLSDLKLVFISEEQLMQELNILINVMKLSGKTDSEIIAEVKAHIKSTYGNFCFECLNQELNL